VSKYLIKYQIVSFVFFLLLWGINNSLSAQAISEYELKGGYLLSFFRFVNWEESAQNDEIIIIGIYGNDNFNEILETIVKQKNKNGIKYGIEHYNSPDEIDDCKILFISGVNQKELRKVLSVARIYPILTVGDEIENFCETGGIINFMPKGSRNLFQINNLAAEKVRITISSKLLLLAELISTMQ